LSEQNIARDSAAISADRAVPGAGGRFQVTATPLVVPFCIVGLALWGLPFYYDFMVRQFGWTRGQVTSGNAISTLAIGPACGFFAGWLVDRFGPRRLMMAGVCMTGIDGTIRILSAPVFCAQLLDATRAVASMNSAKEFFAVGMFMLAWSLPRPLPASCRQR
jgi:MFS family permease